MSSIVNKTNGAVVANEYKNAKSFFDNAFGLLLKSNPRAMFFVTRFGIHTFFMQEAIDVVVLSNTNYVSVIKKNLSLNRIYFWNPKFNKILELPFGAIDKSRTKIGDKLEFG